MSDTTPIDHRHDDDLLSVEDAATLLGVTRDAVRARLRRGTLDGEKIGEHWFVRGLWVDKDTADTTHRATHDATSRDTDTTHDALIDQLRGENTYLRDRLTDTMQQLASERERADVLQREALDRVHALTATVETIKPSPPATPEDDNDTADVQLVTPVDTSPSIIEEGKARLTRWFPPGDGHTWMRTISGALAILATLFVSTRWLVNSVRAQEWIPPLPIEVVVIVVAIFAQFVSMRLSNRVDRAKKSRQLERMRRYVLSEITVELVSVVLVLVTILFVL